MNAKLSSQENSLELLFFQKTIAQSDRATIAALFNCFIREYLVPNDLLKNFNNMDKTKRAACPFSQIELLMHGVTSKSGHRYYFQSVMWREQGDNDWLQITKEQFIQLILAELSAFYEKKFNSDLKQQIINSNRWLEVILRKKMIKQNIDKNHYSLIDSERDFILGHPFHPTPKARQGWTESEFNSYSPEMNAEFQCHYFLVKKYLLKQYLTKECSYFNFLKKISPKNISKKGYIALPMHPYEAQWLISQAVYKKLLASEDCIDLGLQGNIWQATSSVRTLMRQDLHYAIKVSLHIRLTNCIRKNAHYELKHAVILSQIVMQSVDSIQDAHPDFHCLPEPAAFTIEHPEYSASENQCLSEAFGGIVRDLSALNNKHNKSEVLGAMVSAVPEGISRLEYHLIHMKMGCYEKNCLNWMKYFLKTYVSPIITLYADFGIILEPHMQNVIVTLSEDKIPEAVYIRDMEGVKLLDSQWSANISYTHPALFYNENQAVSRIRYCIFVNVISELINTMAKNNVCLEEKLWDSVYHDLMIAAKKGSDKVKTWINEILESNTLPAKGNLSCRFLKNSDKHAQYFPLPNPLFSIHKALSQELPMEYCA